MMRTQDFNFGQEFERIFGTFKQDTIKINGSQSGTTKKKFHSVNKLPLVELSPFSKGITHAKLFFQLFLIKQKYENFFQKCRMRCFEGKKFRYVYSEVFEKGSL